MRCGPEDDPFFEDGAINVTEQEYDAYMKELEEPRPDRALPREGPDTEPEGGEHES